jgi:hypothetical protein
MLIVVVSDHKGNVLKAKRFKTHRKAYKFIDPHYPEFKITILGKAKR